MKKKLSFITLALILILTFSLSSSMWAASNPSPASPSPYPLDVSHHWAEQTIQWGVDQGIVEGYQDGTFKPNQHVSEAEFLAMLIRAYDPSVKAGHGAEWAQPYYDFAQVKNYPVSENVTTQKGAINRLRVAEIVSATQGVNYTGNDAIRYLLGNQLAKGTKANEITIESYNPKGLLTRAEAVQFIKNVLENGKESLQARPSSPSDTKLLPDIPDTNQPPVPPKYDLPYTPPAGWTPPTIQSEYTPDKKATMKILEEELGLLNSGMGGDIVPLTMNMSWLSSLILLPMMTLMLI